jgi:hypothetical protein
MVRQPPSAQLIFLFGPLNKEGSHLNGASEHGRARGAAAACPRPALPGPPQPAVGRSRIVPLPGASTLVVTFSLDIYKIYPRCESVMVIALLSVLSVYPSLDTLY